MARPTPRQLKALGGCVCEVPETSGRLRILPAFGEKADFAALYQAIDWGTFLAASRGSASTSFAMRSMRS
jgi:hypothetical protein